MLNHKFVEGKCLNRFLYIASLLVRDKRFELLRIFQHMILSHTSVPIRVIPDNGPVVYIIEEPTA